MKDRAEELIYASKRVCFFGGAFDPIHKGHTFIAEEALRAFNLDNVIFIPTKVAPHKNVATAPFSLRAKMVSLAIKPYEKFALSEIEGNIEGKSYTLNTVNRLKNYNKEAEYFFLTGSDIFATIKSWFSYKELLAAVRFIVISRKGEEGSLSHLEREILDRIDFLDIETPLISSTDLRNNLEENREYLDSDVYEYIIKKGLYNG